VAINKQDLHDILKNNLDNYSESDAYKNDKENPLHMKIMAETMQSYFEENIEITYGWSATNQSSGSPDPVIFFQSTVKFSAWDLTKPMVLEGLAAKIMASVATGVITHPVEFVVTPGSFLIKPLVLPQHSVADECLMKCIVEPVCNWIVTNINTASLPGMRAGIFIGATVGMAIK
jgi:hypothetical protein